jgi:hypothetical protein
MVQMRQEVLRELSPELAGQGRPSSTAKGNNITFNSTEERGTNPEYTLRRLRRDNPDLAEQVIFATIFF